MESIQKQRYTSVWDALEDTPDAAENMRVRSELMYALTEYLKQTGLNQAQAAQMLGITQPRVSDLMRGKIGLFGLDALVTMAARAGFRVQCTVTTNH